jgi:hypothetical protein
LNINKVCKAFADTHINIAVRNRAEHINIWMKLKALVVWR